MKKAASLFKSDTLAWEKYLLSNGWMDFSGRARQLIQEGMIDPFDAEKVVGPINSATQSATYSYR